MGRLPTRLAGYFPTRNLLMIYAAEGRNDPVPEVMTGSEPATLAPDFDGPPEKVRSGA
jgi:hypothetical protein